MLVTLQNAHMAVSIDTLGAELKSIRDAAGVERLWSGDPAYWAGQAPILFPVVGGLHDDAFEWKGKRYGMGKHGFARVSEFALVSHADDQAVFALREQAATLAQYPFAFELRVRFALEGPRLAVVYEVENRSAEDMPFQVGAHEAYACPEGIEAYEIVFDQPETLDRYELTGSFLNRQTTPWVKESSILPLRPADYAGDAIVFLDAKSTAVTLRSKVQARTLRVDFAGFETLMFWTKPGAPYICVEPWCGAPDFLDGVHALEKRHRIRMLAPGAVFSCEHGITLG